MSKKSVTTPAKKAPKQKQSIGDFFFRFHGIIFFSVTICGLAVAVFLLYSNVIVASDTPHDYTPTTIDAGFDETTIKAVQNLHPATSAPEPYSLPAGRNDPFAQ